MKWLDLLFILLLLLWMAASILWMRKCRKKGKSISCGGDCTHCASQCHRTG